MVLGSVLEVGCGFRRRNIINAGQHPDTQALQRLRPLSITTGRWLVLWVSPTLTFTWVPWGGQSV